MQQWEILGQIAGMAIDLCIGEFQSHVASCHTDTVYSYKIVGSSYQDTWFFISKIPKIVYLLNDCHDVSPVSLSV